MMPVKQAPEVDDDPRLVWQIAADEGTDTSAVRELMLDNWPEMTQSKARAIIRKRGAENSMESPSPERTTEE